MLATLLGNDDFTRILNPAEYGNHALVTTIMRFADQACPCLRGTSP
jgi:hypothetical protein